MELVQPPAAARETPNQNADATPNKEQAQAADQAQTPEQAPPADAPAAPADGEAAAEGPAPGDPAAANAPADGASADAAADAPPASDGTAAATDSAATGSAGNGAATTPAGQSPADDGGAHGAGLGGHGSFAPLRPDGQLGLTTGDQHDGIARDVPALHLFEAAGTLDANNHDVNTLPNTTELYATTGLDDAPDQPHGPVNHAPTAGDDLAVVAEDGVLAGASVLANDNDADGDSLRAELVDGPEHGSLTLNADGTFIYTPEADYNGGDFFTYKAVDIAGASSAPALVALTVTAVNDAPIAGADKYSVAEDGKLVVAEGGLLANDSDAHSGALDENNGPLTVALVEGPAHGSLTLNADGTFAYTPDANFNGQDSFTYHAIDGLGAVSDSATVALTVTSVNDAPSATNDEYCIGEDGTLAVLKGGVLANDSDAHHGAPGEDNGPLTATLLEGPSHGSLTLDADGTFTYTPDADYNGEDSFVYRAVDSLGGTSQAATVTLTIDSVNDAPVAAGDSDYSVVEDGKLVVAEGSLLANDSDSHGGAPGEGNGPLTATLVEGPAHGALTLYADGTFTYTPDADYNGSDSFTYKAVDSLGAASEAATVAIAVTSVNDAPVAGNDGYAIAEDGTLTVDGKAGTLLDNDSDAHGGALGEGNAPLTAELVAGPAHGSLTLHADGTFVYTPAADYNGEDSFTYQAVDSLGAHSTTATVSLAVSAVNDAPVAAADSYNADHDATLAVAANSGVLANDSDVDGNTLTAALVAGPAHGSLTFHDDGSFSYTPENGFDGTDSFTYHAHDGLADSSTVTVSINVIDGNDYLDGTPGYDVLNGGHGNDVIYGYGSGDQLSGGPDNDYIYGGSDWYFDYYDFDGADTIDGGTGNDHVYGGSGNDSISGGDGNDYLVGNSDYGYYDYYDYYYFDDDNDVIDGGKGDDHIYGSSGNDTIYGGEGNDYISGNTDYPYYYGDYYDYYVTDSDWIDSGPGNDTINCSSYDDYYYGYGYGYDSDTIAISSLDGCDLIEGFDNNYYGYNQNVVTLDPLFDALGVAEGERAARVQISDAGNGVWNVNVDADGDGANGFEALVAQIQSSTPLTVSGDEITAMVA